MSFRISRNFIASWDYKITLDTLYFRKSDPLTDPHRRLLNQIAEELRSPYQEMIRQLSEGHAKKIDWWVSELASRNTNTHSLFDDCCRIVFLKTVLCRKKNESSVTSRSLSGDGGLHQASDIKHVVTDSYFISRIVRDYCRRQNLSVVIRWEGSCTAVIKKELGKFLRQVKGGVQALIQLMISRMIPSPLSRWVPPDATLMDTFFFEENIPNELFKDRLYGDLSEYLTAEELRSIVYAPTLSVGLRHTLSALRVLRRHPQNIVLKEDYLKTQDYLFAFFYPLRAMKLLPKKILFQEIDVTSLVRFIWATHLFSCESILGLLNFRFAQRLREKGVTLRLIVDWFENQIIDKGFNAGFRQFYPKVPVLGYQGFVVPRHYLCMFPTENEAENAVLPKVVAVCGAGLIQERKEFCPSVPFRSAPAFRFRGVWSPRRHWPDPDYFTILVVLPLEEGWKDVFLVVARLERTGLPKGYRFWIKPHPAAGPIDRMIHRIGSRLPNDFQTVEENFDSVVEKADVVISNMSSACVESLAKGVPTVVIGSPGGVSQNPIPAPVEPGLWRLCFSPQEVEVCLNDFSRANESDKKSWETSAQWVRETCFEQVTRDSVRKFLSLD